MTEEAPVPHRRRKRYAGTHPRRFDEKYKELGADPEAVAKAKARGSTPAGTHIPIMLPEVLEALGPLEGAVALDCTLGWGGHAEALAGRGASVIGLDRDASELQRTGARLKAAAVEVRTFHANYAGAAKVLRECGLDGVDALLADLGVSSMQLDRPERGMSFKADGPLDMRMDASRGDTAAQWLRKADESEIAEALARYGDEPDAAAIAAAIKARPPKTTWGLVEAVRSAKALAAGSLKKKTAFSSHPAARTFQALRIAVNGELQALGQLLRDLPWLMRPGGRVALLTFHSGEESLVRQSLGEQAALGLWTEAPAQPRKASGAEVRENPRARSARLWRVVRAA
ncbi:MAG: 16S rRNA (cytosine(1402)-N(4))-methyltransferase RsmH [Elusimicrobia bacterium]|nr:16S rRNA (cytosine(1402)-N(4))-methyltransferase RsmH [Elusimicrobiota bacterium]